MNARQGLSADCLRTCLCGLILSVWGAAGWWILIAPSEGPKDVLDVNNIEILLICGLIPSLLGAAIGVFVCRLIEGANERDLYK